MSLMKNISFTRRKEKLTQHGFVNDTGSIKNSDLIVSKELSNTYITTAKSIILHKQIMSFEKKYSLFCRKGYKTDRNANKDIINRMQLSHFFLERGLKLYVI